MKLFVAGGTGFVGSYLLRELAARKHSIKCLARNPYGLKFPEGVTAFGGDALDAGILPGAIYSCDAVINLIGIIREFPSRGITFERSHVDATRNLVEAAKRVGVRRFIHMSANGVREGGTSYQDTKHRGEEIVKSCGLDWTIFRPSLIFGKPPEGKTEFCTEIAGVIAKMPFVPVFDDGDYKLQPVHVKDVAKAFTGALEKPESIGRVFHLGGTDIFTYNDILDIICRAMGKKPKMKIPAPWIFARPIFRLLERFPFFPATAEQIDMLLEGNTTPEMDYTDAFGIRPKKFGAEHI